MSKINSDKFKFTMIFDSFLNVKEGPNTHITEVSRELEKLVDLKLVLPVFAQKDKIVNKTKYLPNLKRKYLFGVSYQLSLLFYLSYCCIFDKPDLIYSRQNFFNISPAIISKIFKIPHIVEINGLIVDELEAINCSKIELMLAKVNERLNYHSCNKIITVTEGIKKGIIDLYNIDSDKIVVINNGANIELFKPINKEKCRTELNLNLNMNYVCFVGSLAPWQGVEFLIKAAPSVLTKCPNTSFIIVGDGVMKKELINLTLNLGILDKFVFTGSVPYEKVPLYINASDICIAPFVSNRKASPLKIYEYLACEKPVIASDIPDIDDLFVNSGGGIKVLPENAESLAFSIIKLLLDEDLRIKMGSKSRKYIENNCTWKITSRKVFEICKSCSSLNK